MPIISYHEEVLERIKSYNNTRLMFLFLGNETSLEVDDGSSFEWEQQFKDLFQRLGNMTSET